MLQALRWNLTLYIDDIFTNIINRVSKLGRKRMALCCLSYPAGIKAESISIYKREDEFGCFPF